MQARLQHVVIYVSDMARSISFYHQMLGLTLQSESAVWSELETGSITLGLHLSAEGAARWLGTNPPGRNELVFRVEDLDSACARLIDEGIPVDGPLELADIGIRVANVLDPDGAAIVLQQPLSDSFARPRILPFSQRETVK